LVKSDPHASQLLYKDWLSQDKPDRSFELNFAKVRLPLQEQEEKLKKEVDKIIKPFAFPLGPIAGSTNGELVSFWGFSGSTNLTTGSFLGYLGELKKSAPTNSWIKKWRAHGDAEEPEDVSVKFLELYNHWSTNRLPNQPPLLITNDSGETANYFTDTWHRLKELKMRQEHLARVEKQLSDLNHAYVGLCIVVPNQPGPGLEMIRFGGP
jgi:hypothetical protein